MTGRTLKGIRAGFSEPDPAARPMMRWWWFGPDVEDAEIDRELRAMAAAGLGGAEVSFVYPLQAGSDTYLSDAALGHLRHAAETARDLGLRFDVTLGSGWSYGGPHIGSEHASRSLRWERRDVSPAPFEVPLVTPWPGDQLVAAFLGDGSPPEAWEPLPLEDGVLRVPAGHGPRTVLLAWSQVTGQQVKRSAAGAEGPVLDHLSADATRHHLAVVGEALLAAVPAELLGSVFCDSLEVYGASWTPRLPEEFARRRGYDPLPLLHRLQIEEPGSAEFRIDVGRTLTELVEENFVAVCQQWAGEHGVPWRIQAYGEPPVSLSSNRFADLIEGEGWGWTGLPQSRWASSAGHLYRREVISSEIWTWVHSPSFRATPLDLKGEAHEHFLLGINHFVGHGWPYSPPEAPGLGRTVYAAGALDDRNPWWPAMPELTAYLTRLSWLLRQGDPVADVKLYLPIFDVYAAHGEGFDLWRACRDHIGPEIPAAIRRAGYDIDLIDDQGLEVLDPQDVPVVVLPAVTTLPVRTRAWLDAVREAGGMVIAVDSPTYPEAMSASRQTFPDTLAASLPPDVALDGGDGEIGVVHRRVAGGELYFVANTGATVHTVRLTPRESSADYEHWDPHSGETSPAQRDGGGILVTLHPYEATVLIGTGAGAGAQVDLGSGVLTAPDGGDADGVNPDDADADGAQRAHGPSSIRLDGPWRFLLGDGELRGPDLSDGDPAAGTRAGTGAEVVLPHRWEDEHPGYCGAGTYETTVHLEPAWLEAGYRLLLDLGPSRPIENTTREAKSYRALIAPPVREIAVVSVNGEFSGVIWDAPHRIDLSDALRPGENTLRLVVHNTAAGRVATDPDAAGVVAQSHRVYGARFQQQDLDLAMDQVESGLHAVPVLHRIHGGAPQPRPAASA
ncbi:glycosyl hydrolase [Brachybacterium sp. FME24]|uniref:glycosyl hydrolase n=1 Tax=Brachybacterium sp. FME24 TaxID=2742605 RepID=UPI0018695893|nr:glycosyl hydrolase [Brachybacterium sp. FME24]